MVNGTYFCDIRSLARIVIEGVSAHIFTEYSTLCHSAAKRAASRIPAEYCRQAVLLLKNVNGMYFCDTWPMICLVIEIVSSECIFVAYGH